MLEEQLPWHVRYGAIDQWREAERLFATGEEAYLFAWSIRAEGGWAEVTGPDGELVDG